MQTNKSEEKNVMLEIGGMLRHLLTMSGLFVERIEYLAKSTVDDDDWAVLSDIIETLCTAFNKTLEDTDKKFMVEVMKRDCALA